MIEFELAAGVMADAVKVFKQNAVDKSKIVQTVTVDVGTVIGALAKGELNQRMDKDYGDLFNPLKASINKGLDNLESAFHEIRDAASQVNLLGDQINIASQTMATAAAAEQSAMVEQVNANLEESDAQVRSNAEAVRSREKMAEMSSTVTTDFTAPPDGQACGWISHVPFSDRFQPGVVGQLRQAHPGFQGGEI